MASSTSKAKSEGTPGDGAVDEKEAQPGSLWERPKGKIFVNLEELLDSPDYNVIVGWGPEGTGKTTWFLRHMPLPVLVLNLDRPLTKGHMGWKGMKERLPGIFVANLREDFADLTIESAVQLKDNIEQLVTQNFEWLKGGTLIIDGGTALREILKMADPVIGAKVASGRRFNPKDKANVNAYLASFIANIQDQGINLIFTGHSANSWEMKTVRSDDGETKNQLTRTNKLYPKLDDILFERATVSLLFFKRCECGRNIVNQDGTCSAQPEATSDKAGALDGHIGRKHMVRFVTNKLQTAVEGSEWEDLSKRQFDILTGPDSEKAKQLLAVSDD